MTKLCSPDLEYLTIKRRPLYIPRELQCILLTVVYIPPSANGEDALSELYSMVNRSENTYPDAAFVVLGDF